MDDDGGDWQNPMGLVAVLAEGATFVASAIAPVRTRGQPRL